MEVKAGFFTNRFNQFAPFDVKRKLVGWNTGNMIFRDALHKMINCDVITPYEPVNTEKYNAFITTDLIWLQEGVSPWPDLYEQLRASGDKPLVPISIGLQSHVAKSDFQIHPKMIDYMSALQERVTLAVRGSYTADILGKHGIVNTEVMGCPSIYQLPLYNRSLDGLLAPLPTQIRATANFRTFIGDLKTHERRFLAYAMQHCKGFAEQTFDPLGKVGGIDDNIIEWMRDKSYIFFDLDSWRRHNARYNFSIGLRFHGNVAALLANIPSLFFTIDSRTSEMTEFLNLPAMNFADFDDNAPLESYFERANYEQFVSSYPAQLKRFENYIIACGLDFSMGYRTALGDFVTSR